MTRSQIAGVSTILICAVGTLLCVGMEAYSFSRGLDVAHAVSDFCRLMHPLTAMCFTDQFVWGRLAGAVHQNYLGARWTAPLLLLVGSWGFLYSEGGKSQFWNCSIFGIGLRKLPARIFAIDIELVGEGVKSCLIGYDFGSPVRLDGAATITILTRRRQGIRQGT